jgi:IPT/TIG domain
MPVTTGITLFILKGKNNYMRSALYLLLLLMTVMVACKKDKDEKKKEPLTIRSFIPVSGNPGTVVTISGTGFEKRLENNMVKFNGTVAEVMVANDTTLMVLSPVGGATGTLEITIGESKATSSVPYTYQSLSVQGISPANGPAGTNVVIRGAGFAGVNGQATVSFNGKEAVIVHAEDTVIIASVPEAAGTGVVHVKIDDMEADGPSFTFQGIESIKPIKGGAGTRVTIQGTGFETDPAKNTVAFNGKTATMISATATELVVEAPAEVASGPVTITINEQKTVGPVFTVVPFPIITTVAPLSGPAGVDVTINGDNFSDDPAEVKVDFNGVAATVKTVSATQLVVTVPASAGKGALKVTINDQPVTGPEFREQALGIAALSPDNALDAGTEITITGSGFSTTAAENHITFSGVQAVVTQATDTELKVLLPAGFNTGLVNVSVNGLTAQGPEFRKAGVTTFIDLSGDLLALAAAIAIDSKGDLYVADGNRILKITAAGTKTVFAGDPDGAAGNNDGDAADALFNGIRALVFDDADNLYVGEIFNNQLRKITPAGVVSSVAQLQTGATVMAINNAGSIFYSGGINTPVYRLEANTSSTRVYDYWADAIAFDAQDNLYISQFIFSAPEIGKFTRAAGGGFSSYKPFAGDANIGYGFEDGIGAQAKFTGSSGMVFDKHSGYFYFVDPGNNAIRSISLKGEVKTITGSPGFIPTPGQQDGSLSTALFNTPGKIVLDKDGNLFVLDDFGGSKIRKIRLR